MFGRFVRLDSGFRDWISRDGSTEFPAEAGRYHLYISKACPWSHRTTIMRTLKGLDTVISTTCMDAFMGEESWQIDQSAFDESGGVPADAFLFEVYQRAAPGYTRPITHFKTDRRRIADYPNLGAYLRELYQVPGIAQTVDMDHIRQHYFQSHRHLNPAGIIPIGPDINLHRPALREDVGRPAMEAAQ